MLSRVAAAGSFQTGFLPLLVRRTDVRPGTVAPDSGHAVAAAPLSKDRPQSPKNMFSGLSFFILKTLTLILALQSCFSHNSCDFGPHCLAMLFL